METLSQGADEHLSSVFQLLGRLANAFVATLGPNVEIVVHDLRQPDTSVVAIAGALTGRRIGSPIPDPEFLPDRLGDIHEDQLRYLTRTPHGRLLNSSTVFVHDHTDRIVGAVCINVDNNDLVQAKELLEGILGSTPSPAKPSPPMTTFASNLEQLVAIALETVEARSGRPRHQITRDDRIEAIRELDRAGVFQLRNATTVIANELGVSRASAFNYLREVRAETLTSDAPPKELA